MLHHTRHLLIRQQTAVINSIRAHLAEFGIVRQLGAKGSRTCCGGPERQAGARGCPRVPRRARHSTTQPQGADFGVRSNDHGLAPIQPNEQAPSLHSRRRAIAGNRPGRRCRRPQNLSVGRNFSAWIGLVPKQHSSGGKERLGNISKQGDRYLRSLFVAGALAVIRYVKIHGTGQCSRQSAPNGAASWPG
jgi:transposase